jgi:hypothetical protein
LHVWPCNGHASNLSMQLLVHISTIPYTSYIQGVHNLSRPRSGEFFPVSIRLPTTTRCPLCHKYKTSQQQQQQICGQILLKEAQIDDTAAQQGIMTITKALRAYPRQTLRVQGPVTAEGTSSWPAHPHNTDKKHSNCTLNINKNHNLHQHPSTPALGLCPSCHLLQSQHR